MRVPHAAEHFALARIGCANRRFHHDFWKGFSALDPRHSAADHPAAGAVLAL